MKATRTGTYIEIGQPGEAGERLKEMDFTLKGNTNGQSQVAECTRN